MHKSPDNVKNTTNSGNGVSIKEISINNFIDIAIKNNINAKKNINKPNLPNKCIGLSNDLSKNLITSRSKTTFGIRDNPYFVFPAILG